MGDGIDFLVHVVDLVVVFAEFLVLVETSEERLQVVEQLESPQNEGNRNDYVDQNEHLVLADESAVVLRPHLVSRVLD